MIAANSSVPYIPRLVTLIEPPSSSCCRSRPDRARSARSRAVRATVVTVMSSTPRSTGVTSPLSVATATATSTGRSAARRPGST